MYEIYSKLSQKQKQLLVDQYPYRKDKDVFKIANVSGTDNINSLREDIELYDDISLLSKRDYVVPEPNREGREPNIVSLIDVAMRGQDEESIRQATELAKQDHDGIDLLNAALGIQAGRLPRALEYEADYGPNPDTEAVMSNLINIIKLINNAKDGQKMSVTLENTFSDILMGINNGDIDIDDESFDDGTIPAEFTVKEDD